MEEIELIVADSSSIYEFSSKQISDLDDKWDGSWIISDTLGGVPVIEGTLTKNENILNDDSLVGEDFRATYKIFESNEESVILDDPIIVGSTGTINGRIFVPGADTNGNEIEIPVPNKYLYLTIKGVFVPYNRTVKVKSDANGLFSVDFDLGKTIKTVANSFFIFQLMPLQSEQLELKDYILSVEVKQKDDADNIIFRREVLQAKLKMKAQGVL